MLVGGDRLNVAGVVPSLAAVDPRELSDDELASECLQATVLVHAVTAYAAALLVEFQQRGAWADDGAISAAAWVSNRTGTRRADLASLVKTAIALRQLPDAAQAARAGEVSFDHARRLADCVRAHPTTAARDADILLEQARALDADSFRALAQQWRSLADDEAHAAEPPAETEPEPERRSAVHLSKLADGSYRLDGNLRPDHGDLLNAVLEEHVDRQLRAQRDGDPSLAQMLPSALRAEALVDLAAQHCRRQPGDDSVPDRYRVGVTLTPDDLQHPSIAGCDSELFRIVVNAPGEILDIGRTTRAWTNGIRRAANQRDHGCVFPGCDRPPSWCDLHHCIEWHPCGTTSIDNAASLCRRHHTFIHNHGWRVVIPRARGKPVVLRPDGTPYTIDRVTLDWTRS